nr:hypothetical protein [Tanacetum cinerariifolium]
MSTPKFAETHNLVAFLEKSTKSEGFEQIIDFLNANPIKYALTIQDLVDKKKAIITKTSVRSDLRLEDAKGTECLPNAIIFEQLTLMGAKTTAWNKFSSTMASAIICLATIQKFNFSKYVFDHMVKNLEDAVKFLMFSRFVQVFLDSQVEGMLKHKEIYVTPSHTKKIFANMKRQGKDFSDEHVTITSSIHYSVGRIIKDLDADEGVSLVDETQGRNDQDMFDTSILDDKEVVAEKEVSNADSVPTAGEEITMVVVEVSTTAITSQISMDEITLVKALIDIRTSKPKEKGIVMQEPTQMQPKLEVEERLARRKEEETNIALIESWDKKQAMIDAYYKLATRLQEEEIGELTIEEKSRLFVELMDKRKKYFARLRAE